MGDDEGEAKLAGGAANVAFRVLFRERGYKVEMANRVGKFRTNVAAVAGSCDCVQWGFSATSWENSAPTLRPLPDHVIMFNWGVWATSWENSARTLRPLPDHVIVFNGGFG